MRMDQTAMLTAEEIVNEWPERELGDIFREYGEEPQWKRAAHEIVAYRRKEKIKTRLRAITEIKNSMGKG